MCKTATPSANENQTTKRVVIVGAGPAGLLASILLLRRNENQPTAKYQITLVDPGTNYGKLDSKGLQRKRSWMIGLSAHGLSAIQSVDGLYENYVRGLGIDIEKAVLSLSPKMTFERKASDILGEGSAFTVDRNFVCAALARYLIDKYDKNPKSVVVRGEGENEVENDDVVMDEFVSYYNTKALYVDYEKNRLLVRNKEEKKDMFIDYDLIIGCDGIRSIVRNAIASTNRDFEFSISDTFSLGKGFHVDCPKDVHPGTFFLIIDAVPNMISFTLPETGGKLNVNLGFRRDMKDKIDPVLLSNDVDGISAYFKKHFHAFELDCDDAAKQWVDQGWNTISQVHCNIYHDSKRKILLMGDAAHATSPQIGQGMNTALADAAAFDVMLDTHKDDLETALETFSKERVKEGNALTYLSYYTMSFSSKEQMMVQLGSVIRGKLNRMMPSLFDMFPMDEIPIGGKLSVAYDKMTKLGIIPKIRATNDSVKRNYFEKSCGMVTESSSSTSLWMNALFVGVVAGIGVKLFPMMQTFVDNYVCS